VIIVVASVLAVLTVPLVGRSLAPLSQLRFRRVWLVWLSLSVQLLITVVPAFPMAWGEPLHLLTFAASAAFIWSNRHIRGIVPIAIGAALNLLVIAVNGGTMPASEWAWNTAGFGAAGGGFENSAVNHTARLPWLGDVFAIPAGWPLSNVFSIGDVVIVIAVGYLAHQACRPAPAVSKPSAADDALGLDAGRQTDRRAATS
jgi:hypothetical protein